MNLSYVSDMLMHLTCSIIQLRLVGYILEYYIGKRVLDWFAVFKNRLGFYGTILLLVINLLNGLK